MSRIKETVKEIEATKGLEEQKEIKLVSITLRITEEDMWRLELIAKHLGYSRTCLAQIILPEGIVEAAEGLGFDLPELQALRLSEKSGKSIEKCREMLSQTGFFSVEAE